METEVLEEEEMQLNMGVQVGGGESKGWAMMDEKGREKWDEMGGWGV